MSITGDLPQKQRPKREAWQRWVIIWHVVFYLTLALPTAWMMFAGPLESSRGLVLGLSLALGAWYTLIVVWQFPRSGEKYWFWSLIYLAGALVLWTPLARAHPSYYLAATSFYGLMWGTLPFGLAVAGNILLTGLIIWLQAQEAGRPVNLSIEILPIYGAVLGFTVLGALWVRAIMRESEGRKALIEQLDAAQQDLAAAERQAGVLQERQRLAGEIHDTLAQGFTSIVMQLEAADQALPGEADAAQGHIQRALDTARASLAEARRLVQALQPASLEGASLPEALTRVVNRWSKETGIRSDFAITGDPYPLYPDAEVTLLRATQEALTNVHKHAQAQAVSVTLSYMQDQVALDVQDDGIGFDPEKQATAFEQTGSGFGLRTMRQRAAQFGGAVIVESVPGQGATLAIQIPIGDGRPGVNTNAERASDA